MVIGDSFLLMIVVPGLALTLGGGLDRLASPVR
jgi:hypothetical protein